MIDDYECKICDLVALLIVIEIQFKLDHNPNPSSSAVHRKLMRKHRNFQKSIANRMKVRDAAIAALPPKMREAAMLIDYNDVPLNIRPPFHTPPVPGVLEKLAEEDEEQAELERQRK